MLGLRCKDIENLLSLVGTTRSPFSVLADFFPYGIARTTPLPSCGDPARVRRRGQTAPAGGPGTPDGVACRWLGADDRPGRLPVQDLKRMQRNQATRATS